MNILSKTKVWCAKVGFRKIYLRIGICSFAVLLIVGSFLNVTYLKSNWDKKVLRQQESDERFQRLNLTLQGYVELDEMMRASGYTELWDNNNEFVSDDSSRPPIRISFDFKKNVCHKNEYTFDLSEAFLFIDGETYIKKDTLNKITGATPLFIENEWKINFLQPKGHDWTTINPPLIAHALGAVREQTFNSFYTNSREALIQNYNLGHRVFEADLLMTYDGNLAAVHGWGEQGYSSDFPPISQAWAQGGVWASPSTANTYTPLLIGDILDEMMVNTDMFLVTDTKTDSVEPFKVIYAEAIKRDVTLLNRIIPQIYNRAMYQELKEVHPFQSIIFTLYMTNETNDEIIEFVSNKEDIKVITTWGYAGRMREGDAFLRLAEVDKMVYVHTLNAFWDITAVVGYGVAGIYTDLLTPAVFSEYTSMHAGK